MATITLEYDARNTNSKNILSAILATDFFKVKKTRSKAEDEFYKSLEEAGKMAREMKKGKKFQTLDQFLKTL